MTQKELALLIGKDVKTLRNWKEENPELIRLIKQGLALDESVKATEEHLKRLKKIQEEASK